MTEDRLALTELLEKAGERDFLRAVAEAVLQQSRLVSSTDRSHARTGAWLFIEPDVLHAPTVEEAVHYDRKTLHPGLPAGR